MSVRAGNSHLNSEGGRITDWFDVLPEQDSLVGNQLHIYVQHIFHFQNNLVLTSKDRRSAVRDTFPFRIKVSVPW